MSSAGTRTRAHAEMPHLVASSIAGLIVSGALTVGSFGLWIARKNENHRKTLYLILVILGLVGCLESSFNFTGDTRIVVDGRTVEWVRPIFLGVQGVLLSLALSILFGLSEYLMAACAIAVAAAAAFAEFLYLGDTDANRKPDLMWFSFISFTILVLFIVKAWDVYNHSSPTIWIFMAASLFGIAFLTAEVAAGNAFLHTFPNENVEAWIGWVGARLILFGLVPLGIIIFHGEKPIVNKLIALKNKGKTDV